MAGRTPTLAAIAAASLLAPAAAAEPKGAGTCQVTRILADGRQVRSTGEDMTTEASRSANGSSAYASSASHGRSSASSSSSVSSSSGPHGSSARAVSSYTDEQGRTVTTTRDENGCRTVIDERE